MTDELVVHPSDFWATAETIEKITKRKVCIAGARGDCGGQIIDAHTIPRSQLQKIAENGHVYHIPAGMGELYRNAGRLIAQKRGIRQFSVLNFFCAQHDREIFSHLENDELIFDARQLALLHYRCMGAELYKKIAGVGSAQFQIDRLREKGERENASKLQFATAFAQGSMLGLRDVSRTFERCESVLVEEDYESIRAVVVYFKRMPSIMTVGGFSPEFDYNGRLLQLLGDARREYHQIGLSVLAAQGRAALAFTWLSKAIVCRDFVNSFLSINPSLYTTLTIQTAFEHIENTCMNVGWWDTLRSVERDILLRRMQFAGSPFEARTSSCLEYCGVTFDQWDFDGLKFVGED